MDYIKTSLKEELVIRKIITVHYFEYAKDYIFEGEKHDFWEFLYVDKGEVEVMADMHGCKLIQGEMIFHKPYELHNVCANGRIAPNLIVISFECKSKAMRYFENKILSIDDFEKNLLALIIREAKEAYSSPLDLPSLKKLEKKPGSFFGSEQLVGIYLEQMLIHMIRRGRGKGIKTGNKLSSSVKERTCEDMAQKVIHFLEDNLTNKLSLDDVCHFSSLGRTNIKVLFKQKTGMSVMEYYKKMKIEEAKKMIREGRHNFTEIADILGYTSIHYFSRHFKRIIGMSPSQYALSVKVKI